MTFADLAIIGLAANRLWMIYQQASFTYALRMWAERTKDAKGLIHLVAYHLWCPFCMSISIGALAVAVYAAPGGWWVLLGLAAGNLLALINEGVRAVAKR